MTKLISSHSSSIKKFIICVFIAIALSHLYHLTLYLAEIYENRSKLAITEETPLGGDFLAFYIAGKILNDHSKNDLYNFALQHSEQKKIFFDYPKIANSPLPFVYPPLVAHPFKYLAKFDFFIAYQFHLLISGIIYIFSIFLLSLTLKHKFLEAIISQIIALGFVAFSGLSWISGQTSYIAIFIFSSYFYAFSKGKKFLSGLLLSLSYYKPPLFLVFVIILFLRKEWRVLYGFFSGAIFLVLISIFLFSDKIFYQYYLFLLNYNYGPELALGGNYIPDFRVSLLSYLTKITAASFLDGRIIFLLVFICALFFYYLFINLKLEFQFPIIFASQVMLSLLLSIHLNNYDLSIFIIVILILGNYQIKRSLNFSFFFNILCIFLIYNEWVFRHHSFKYNNINNISVFLIIWTIFIHCYFVKDLQKSNYV